MTETALYRKYRPQTFADVLGQAQIVSALEGAIAQDKVGHAYLFSGTRGTGKTSLARIFSRAIGTHERDLHEIDAASNRGVDDIRALREEVHALPFESPKKVYIIDEVHMLTKEAFNALLKTLEEPPAHVVFILATTELEKLPDTIVSRCQSFTFKKPTIPILKKMLLRVAKSEGYSIEPASAELMALFADGSFRDTHGILQKVIASSKKKAISAEEVEAIVGAPKSALIVTLLDAIGNNDLEKALTAIRSLADAGNDMRIILTFLTRTVRAILICRGAPALAAMLKNEFSETEYEAVERHAKESGKTINSKLLIALLDAHMRTGSTYIAQLPLELACIEHLEQT